MEQSGGYYALVKRADKQFRRSLKSKDRKLAERRLSDFRAQVAKFVQKPIQVPAREQFRRLIETIRESDGRLDSQRKAKPGADLIELLAYSGCRIAEAGTPTWADVDLEAGTLRITTISGTSAPRPASSLAWTSRPSADGSATRTAARSPCGFTGIYGRNTVSPPQRKWRSSQLSGFPIWNVG